MLYPSSLVPGPSHPFHHLQYRTASDGKLGGDLGTRLIPTHTCKVVCDRIAREGFHVVRSAVIRWHCEDARRFYCEHQGIPTMCTAPPPPCTHTSHSVANSVLSKTYTITCQYRRICTNRNYWGLLETLNAFSPLSTHLLSQINSSIVGWLTTCPVVPSAP